MGRILAIDFGLKRTGLAVSDETKTFAFPLMALKTHEVETFLTEYVSREKVELFVLGISKKNDGTTSDIEKHIQAFIQRLQKIFPTIPIERYDERFTSQIAQHILLQGGYKKKERQDKKTTDKISATIILQDYLDQKRNI